MWKIYKWWICFKVIVKEEEEEEESVVWLTEIKIIVKSIERKESVEKKNLFTDLDWKVSLLQHLTNF